MKYPLLTLLALAATVSMLYMSWTYLLPAPSGILVGKPVAETGWYPPVLRLHVGLGGMALVLGTLVMATADRPGWLSCHRRLGYGYVAMVLGAGLAGLVVAPFAIGGWISATGLLLLDVAWVSLTVTSVRAIRRGWVARHRELATYSLALTFSSITLRLLLVAALLGLASFLSVYRFATWACWLINLGVAVWWVRYRRAGSVVLLLLLSVAVWGQPIAPPARGYELAVRVSGLRTFTGTVRVCLVNEEADFLRSCFRSGEAAAARSEVTVTLRDVPPASYAIMLYHDKNENGRLDRNGPFGLPSEPYGFSNNPRSWFGPPDYGRCTFRVKADTLIHVQF